MSADVAVLQAGAWGTTLATILARDGGRDVILWTRDPGQAEELGAQRENRRYLPGIRIPESVRVTADLAAAAEADDLIAAVPTQGVVALRERLRPLLRPAHSLLSASKGLDADGRRMSELWAEALPASRIAVLSGPNLSREIANAQPAPTVVASSSPATARRFQALVGTRAFRAYTNDDVVGVELCGALKNVIALGAGAVDGIGYGENAKAGFMTRGLAEIARFAFARGGDPLTAAGLAGFGDLVATCSSPHSRNRRVGELLAKGLALTQIAEQLGGQVAEGIATTAAVWSASRREGIEMPITEQTHAVLFEGRPVRAAMRELMGREQREEISGPLAEVSRLLRAARTAPR